MNRKLSAFFIITSQAVHQGSNILSLLNPNPQIIKRHYFSLLDVCSCPGVHLVHPPDSKVEALTPVWLYVDLGWRLSGAVRVGPLSHSKNVKAEHQVLPPCVCAQRRGKWRCRERVIIYLQARKRALTRNSIF